MLLKNLRPAILKTKMSVSLTTYHEGLILMMDLWETESFKGWFDTILINYPTLWNYLHCYDFDHFYIHLCTILASVEWLHRFFFRMRFCCFLHGLDSQISPAEVILWGSYVYSHYVTSIGSAVTFGRHDDPNPILA